LTSYGYFPYFSVSEFRSLQVKFFCEKIALWFPTHYRASHPLNPPQVSAFIQCRTCLTFVFILCLFIWPHPFHDPFLERLRVCLHVHTHTSKHIFTHTSFPLFCRREKKKHKGKTCSHNYCSRQHC
jgi:hypothetical protein